MHSYPHFSIPSVHPGYSDSSPSGGVSGGAHQPTSDSDHDHHHLRRVAVGGRVIERELNAREPAADALPDAIDF